MPDRARDSLEGVGLLPTGNGAGSRYVVLAPATGATRLLPLSHRDRAAAARLLHQPGSLAGRALRLMARAGVASATVALDTGALDRLRTAIAEDAAARVDALALHVPWRSNESVLVLALRESAPVAFVRLEPHARVHALEAEAEAVRLASGQPELEPHVPRVLGAVRSVELQGRLVGALALGPVDLSRPRLALTAAHRRFLAALGRVDRGEVDVRGWLSAAGIMTPPLGELAASLVATSDTSVDVSLAHGDFTPWNARAAGECLSVIDWADTRRGAIVGVDVVHFLLSASLYGGRRCGPADVVDAVAATYSLEDVVAHRRALLACLDIAVHLPDFMAPVRDAAASMARRLGSEP